MAGGKDTRKGTSPVPKDGVGGHASESEEYDSDAEQLEQLRQFEEKEKAAQLEKDKFLADLQEKKRLKDLAKELLLAAQATGALAGSSGGAGDRAKQVPHFSICALKFEGKAHVNANKTVAIALRQTPKHNPVQDLRDAEANGGSVKVVIVEKGKVYKIFDEKDGK